jgi:hypothetical protein
MRVSVNEGTAKMELEHLNCILVFSRSENGILEIRQFGERNARQVRSRIVFGKQKLSVSAQAIARKQARVVASEPSVRCI